MTALTATTSLVLAATSTKSSSSSLITFLPLIVIGLAFYFFFMRPQQKKRAAAAAGQKSDIEVGDEVQTVGGVIGTVLEIHGDRYTLLTGALGEDGNLDGPQPTRIVFVRQAIARKVDRVVDVAPDDEPDPFDDELPAGEASTNGTRTTDLGDIDDVGGDSATKGEHHGEAEEA